MKTKLLNNAITHANKWTAVTNEQATTLEQMANNAKADLGANAHLVYLSPNGKKGGTLSADEYQLLLANTVASFGGEHEQFVKKGKFVSFDSATKKKLCTFKGKDTYTYKGETKPMTLGVAMQIAKNDASSRLDKISKWLDPDFIGVVGKSEKIKDDTDSTARAVKSSKAPIDRIRKAIESARDIASNDTAPTYDPVALINDLKKLLAKHCK